MAKIEYDYLTGLANRQGLYVYYQKLKKHHVVHAMFIDIDNFKRVNDIYGHSMGDKLLIEISHLIQQHSNGFTSRIGGDEYVVLLDGSMQQKAVEKIASDLIEDMENIDFRADILSLVSLSIGIVFNQTAGQPLDDILAKCDAAMYQSKYDGKNRYTIYHSYDKTLEISRNIEAEMEDALATGQFQIYLQPKINIISSKLVGAEALSRWIHPIDGIRTPNMFIPLFEKNGFISKLDMYVYEEVCRLKASWEGQPYQHIPISVNMSRLHLYNKNFANDLERIAGKYGIPTDELELEITESTFLKDNKELINVVNTLQSRGFHVSIDDFGSGFSALNLLKDLDVDVVKIDREFLQTSAHTARGRTVIRSVIMMCRDLKIDVVTEGVETQEHIDLLKKCGCQIVQGFFYSRPLPVADFIRFANEYLSNIQANFTFRLNGNLKSEDGNFEAIICGTGLTYEEGIFTDSKALHFPGGDTMCNIIELPADTILSDSFTLSMWIRPEQLTQWTAVLYIKCETGFYAICPLAWEGHSDFRIRDSREFNGWYDASACQLHQDYWWHVVITYNANTEIGTYFINGDMIDQSVDVPTNHYVKMITIGGDVFQPSFVGRVCEIVIYNETQDYDFVKELHRSYIEAENFNAGELKSLI